MHSRETHAQGGASASRTGAANTAGARHAARPDCNSERSRAGPQPAHSQLREAARRCGCAEDLPLAPLARELRPAPPLVRSERAAGRRLGGAIAASGSSVTSSAGLAAPSDTMPSTSLSESSLLSSSDDASGDPGGDLVMCSLRTLRPAPAFPRRLRNATKQAATHIVTKTSTRIRLERRERAAAAACGRRALREGGGHIQSHGLCAGCPARVGEPPSGFAAGGLTTMPDRSTGLRERCGLDAIVPAPARVHRRATAASVAGRAGCCLRVGQLRVVCEAMSPAQIPGRVPGAPGARAARVGMIGRSSAPSTALKDAATRRAGVPAIGHTRLPHAAAFSDPSGESGRDASCTLQSAVRGGRIGLVPGRAGGASRRRRASIGAPGMT